MLYFVGKAWFIIRMKKLSTDTAVEYFGSKVNLAKALGITRAAITSWKEHVPELRAYQLEAITQGKLKAIEQEPENAKNNAPHFIKLTRTLVILLSLGCALNFSKTTMPEKCSLKMRDEPS